MRLHRRRARVAEDGTIAERARTELHPALEPADDLLLRRARRRRSSISAASSISSNTRAAPSRRRARLSHAEGRAEIGTLHAVAVAGRLARLGRRAGDRHPVPRPAPRRHRRPPAGSRCSRRVLRAGPSVGDAVERDAAGQAEVLQAGLGLRSVRASRSINLLGDQLAPKRARSMSRCVSGTSGGRGGPPNSLSNLLVGHRQARAIVEVALIEAERAVGLEVDEIVEDELARTWVRHRAQAPSPCIHRR